MKKFLSLVLALVMTASLVTVSAGAKEFKDDKDVTYDEAVAVISEVGVVDGDKDGNFRPTDNLSRGAAAKIICNLILGPTTAAELKADTAPYKDVPVSNVFSGYIAYCAKEGIISGYADGSFRPAGTLTGYAFMKMLLGALGYDGAYEGYTGANWSINVAKQAIGIGLNKGLTKEFNGVDFVTREEAALYAFNTLKATLVSYDQKITTNVNGVDVTITQGAAKPVTWSEGKNNDGNIKPDGFVQFAEEYFPKLVGKTSSDDFERPATQWIFDKKDIGTYVRWEKMVEKYTTGVSGKDLYDLLTGAIIDDNDVLRFVDGGVVKSFKADKVLVRSNKSDLASTGNGVLTEVYLDTDEKEIRIVSINTWLAQATADYSESTESATVKMYTNHNVADGKNITKTETVDVEDVPAIAELKKDQYILVNRSEKGYEADDNVDDRVIVAISDVEILEDCTVTGFSKNTEDKENYTGEVAKGLYDSVTTGGEKYDGAAQAHYDATVLNQYDADLLKDNKYNVYLDPYGYVIGVDLFEGTKNYVFITGYNRLENSNISIETSKAAAIFVDGTMKTIEVNVSATNDNIEAVYGKSEYQPYFESGDAAKNKGNGLWVQGGEPNENKWYTYTENDGVYTLKPVKQQSATGVNDIPGATSGVGTIDSSKVYLPDSYRSRTASNFAYGDDDSVYIVVSQGKVDTTLNKAITDVDGVYTGVQEVKIEIDQSKINSNASTDLKNNQYHVDPVYTVYDGDNYVIASVVIGEAQGANKNYAYILSGAKSEKLEDGVTYWTFDAVVGGEKKTLTIADKFSNTVKNLVPYSVQELMFDGDYVVKIKSVNDKVTCALEELDPNNDEVFDVIFDGTRKGTDTANVNMLKDLTEVDSGAATTTINAYSRTLTFTDMGAGAPHGTNDKNEPVGLAFEKDAPIVVLRNVNGKEETTPCTTLDEALSLLSDADTTTAGQQFRGRVVAGLNNGRAAWAVFISGTKLGVKDTTGTGSGTVTDGLLTYDANNWKGIGLVNYKVATPEWAGKTATVTYTIDIMADGFVIDTIDTNNTFSASAGSASGTWRNLVMDEDAKITAKLTSITVDKAAVKYVDGDNGTVLFLDSWNDKADRDTKKLEATPTEELSRTTGARLNFTVDTDDTTTSKLQYTLAGTANDVATKTVLTPAANAAQTVPAANTTAKGDQFVVVTIYGLNGLNETYDIKVSTTSTPNTDLKNYKNVDSTETATLTIDVKNATGLKAGQKFDLSNVEVKLSAAADKAYTYKVTIDGMGSAVVHDNTVVKLSGNYPVTGDVEITKDMVSVEVAEKKQDLVEATWDEDTVTLTFAEALNDTCLDGVKAWTKTDVTFADGGKGNTAALTAGVITIHGNTVTLTFSGDKLVEGNKITLNQTKLEAVLGPTTANKCDNTENVITLDANGRTTIAN